MKKTSIWYATMALMAIAVAALLGFPAHGYAAQRLSVVVVGISDGDTIKVLQSDRSLRRVRLAQIDAPETGQPFAKRSKQALAGICFGKQAEIELEGQDHYGRSIARVSCNGVDAQSFMVRNGLAWVFTRYATDKTLLPLQERARMEGAGLWADAHPTPPWEYRHLTK